MMVTCIGGGPAGLYFSILAKIANPHLSVRILEANRPRATVGWGLILSNGLISRLEENDPVSGSRIREAVTAWGDITVSLPNARSQPIRSKGHSFLSLSRLNLISILQERAEDLGVEMNYETRFDPAEDPMPDSDLVVVADGLRSKVREQRHEDFAVTATEGANRYIWLGFESSVVDTFRFIFERTEAGYIWAHCYQFEPGFSTFVVECSEATWRGLGFDHLTDDDALDVCRRIFRRHLDGRELLMSDKQRNRSPWTRFLGVECGRWNVDNLVLLGNAAHSTHFSIGSGTRLALGDAIELARTVTEWDRFTLESLATYERNRKLATQYLHTASQMSLSFFEEPPFHLVEDEPQRFAYQLVTRSGRIGPKELFRHDTNWANSLVRNQIGEAVGKPA